MDFNELFEKYLNDESFKGELIAAVREDAYEAFAAKHDIPYSFEEVQDFADAKTEASNCPTRTSKSTYEELKLVDDFEERARYYNNYFGQKVTNHPVIVTLLNKSCSLASNAEGTKCRNCSNCGGSVDEKDGLVLYCLRRSEECHKEV